MTRSASGRCRAVITLLVACVAAAFSIAPYVDTTISDTVFRAASGWPVPHTRGPLRLFLYDSPTWLLGLLAIWLAVGTLRPVLVRRLGLSGREALYVVTCLVSVPLAVGTLKHLSGVACAYDLARYGGTLADSLGHLPFTRMRNGGCWPAAHPSGAFALVCLGMLPRSRVVRIRLWLLAAAAGTALGVYQVLRGAHFASHIILTAVIAQVVACILAMAILPPRQGAMRSTPPM